MKQTARLLLLRLEFVGKIGKYFLREQGSRGAEEIFATTFRSNSFVQDNSLKSGQEKGFMELLATHETLWMRLL